MCNVGLVDIHNKKKDFVTLLIDSLLSFSQHF